MNKQSLKSDDMVCIKKSTYQTIDLDSLLTPLGHLNKYIKKDERILLKVSLLNASIPSKAVVTNPLLVKKTAKAVLKAGGEPYIGDSPSGQFTKRRLERVYKKAGLLKISDELADIIAWTSSLANILDIDLEKALVDKYPNKCLSCDSNPCKCDK